MGKRELEIFGSKLLDVGPLDVCGLLELDNLQNVNRSEAGTVAGSHVVVKRLDSIGAGELTVLLVHVVGARAGIVANPDPKVLHRGRALLENLVDADDFPVRLLNTTQTSEKVPETRLGNYLVGCKNAHAVELGLRMSLAGQMASNDLVLVDATHGV